MNEINKIYDIIVIGGGISGLGMAYEASNAGFELLLLEKTTFGSATSANSLRIIHGGLRYLQTLGLSRSINSIRAQSELLKKFPEIIKPLPCIYPLSGSGLKCPLTMSFATLLYRALYKYAANESTDCRVVSSNFVEREIPLLKGFANKGALLWQDALLQNPSKLIQTLVENSQKLGAVLEEGAEVVEVLRASSGVFSITVRCQEGVKHYRSRSVINMSGPWLDQINIRLAFVRSNNTQNWCRAFNVVISKQIDSNYAIAIDSKRGAHKKRAFFCVPRGNASVIGTEYLPLGTGEDRAKITDFEAEDFVKAFSEALPNLTLTSKDIVSVESGILPVENFSGGKIRLVGKELITDFVGYQEVLSTKYTTFLTQARQVLKQVSKWLPR